MPWWKRSAGGDDDAGAGGGTSGSADAGAVSAGLPASRELFETWLEEMDPKITGFEMFGLPKNFSARIYSRDALGELQPVIRDRLGTPETVTDGSETAVVDGAIRLIGQTLIRHIGGHWHYTTDPDVPWRGRPVLVLDVPHSSEDDPIDVLKLLINTIKRPQADVLLDVFDTNHAAKPHHDQPTDSPGLLTQPPAEPGTRLAAWLETMDTELQAWKTGPAAPADRWDHSLDSLTTLGHWILERYPEGTDWLRGDITPEQEHELTGAVRYIGQTLLTHYPGRWRYSEGEKRKNNPFSGRAVITRDHPDTLDPISTVPEVSIGAVLRYRDPECVTEDAERYAPRHLRRKSG